MNVGGIQQMGIKWEEDGRVGWGLEALLVVVTGGSFEDERERLGKREMVGVRSIRPGCELGDGWEC